MGFTETIPEKIKTSNDERQSSPDFIILNPLTKAIFCTQIELVPNPKFAEKGQVIVKLNQNIIYNTKKIDAPFSDYSVITIPLNDNELLQNNKIEFFVWNSVDTEEIALNTKTTISETNSPPPPASIGIPRSDKNRGTPNQGTLASPDGGSGITATAYTCPPDFKAKVLKFESRVKTSGSASEVHLKIRGTRIKTWKNTTIDPHNYPSASGASGGYYRLSLNIDARKIWSDGSYPEFNVAYEDLQDEELDEGDTIAFDGDFSSNFNATIDYAYTILETRKV